MIAGDPYADLTDVYAFVAADKPDSVTLIMNAIPYEDPMGGPNYYQFDPKVRYQLHVAQAGHNTADITYNVEFQTTVKNPNTFLYNFGPFGKHGDPNLNVEQTVKNAIWRQGSGTPVHLSPEDFEVERTELLTRSATVLMLDVSLSMPMRDNFLPAKKVAMALHALITSQFPRDYFGLVSFGRVAREVKPELLPEMSWDFEWGTNMQHALLLARKQLSRQTGTKQIIMVTDGEPTAHIEGGEAYFQYPPSPVTIEETLKEVMRCTRDRIRINTFMLDESYYLKSFVEQMMRVNGGRAFFTNADTLGDYVLVDFLDHRRQQQRRAG